MNDFFKYFGALCVILCAFFIARAYTSYLGRRVLECECFLSLVERAGTMISCFLSPIADIFSGFECESDGIMAFVCDVRGGVPVRDAFLAREGELAIGKEGKKILTGLFSELGHGYKNGTVALVTAAREELERLTAREREEREKNSKLVTALLVGGAVGILLLFL